MRKLTLLLFLATATLLFAQKENTRDYVSIAFLPNHADWTYSLGEKVEIEVSARCHYAPIPDVELAYEWGPELRQPELKATVSSGKKGVQTLRLNGAKEPGFKTLKVTVSLDGKEYFNTINLAFAPEKIMPTTPLPADFQSFWEKTISEARRVPLQPVFTPHPELNTPYSDVYEVRFQNFAKGQYLYGMLCVPKGVHPADTVATRRYPAVILWPGAGVKPHLGCTAFFPEHDCITLEMGINGISVSLPQQVYTDLRANALTDYNTIHQDDRDKYYYRKVFAGTVKTVDLLCSMAAVDTTRIACYGGSQGGALSVVNAALDPRIRAAAVAYPALAEIAGYARGRVGGWPKFFRKEEADKKKVEVSEYYDVVNFARFVTCPVWFQIGYNDQVCCPTSTYSVYNTLSCPKELFTPLDCAHWQYPEHKRLMTAWLLDAMMK